MNMDTQAPDQEANPEPSFGIDELCALGGVVRRTVRFYTQKGLLDPPKGAKRGAYYTRRHLEQLLLIRKWQQAGVSLERIGRLLRGDMSELPPPTEPGTLEVWSRLTLRPGLEIHLEPGRLGLDPKQVRELITLIIQKVTSDSLAAGDR
jgi:DNA-binding transcriptional MerR regulator